ncbi:MAG: hypothetical protein A2017_02105 [Lentisphaerae bacterium GWF2_44_16]|nr:MAG: hypothetical protein A2017_02105 [Lentisphaerae bacterium GWF2_44_16]
MKENHSIAALERGLKIIDYLIRAGDAVRYRDIKTVFAEITDASLNRLLKSLISQGYLIKEDNSYRLGEPVKIWGTYLSGDDSFLSTAEFFVEKIAENLKESAAFVHFDGEKINTDFVVNVSDSINITLRKSGTLYFEYYHAGALAVMDHLPEESVAKMIKSQYSHTPSMKILKDALSEAKRKEGYYVDTPQIRKGLKRISVFVPVSGKVASFFICVPSERAEQNEKEYGTFLLKCVDEWKKLLSGK